MKFSRSTIVVATVAVLTLATTNVVGAANRTPVARAKMIAHTAIQRGGTLTFNRVQDIVSLDPTQVTDNESIWADESIFEPLFAATPNGKSLVPDMATSYSVSANKLRWTFNLRQGVKFSNGQEMTSADAKFSIERVGAKASNPWTFINSDIASITTPSKFQVVVTTKTPWAPLQADMALFANGVIPNNFAGESATTFWNHPIGTGPFVVQQWLKGSELKLVRNTHYWQAGKPYLNGVNFVTVPDDNTRLLQLESGAAQIDEFPAWSQISELQSKSGITTKLFPSSWTQFLGFNEQYAFFKDVHVRRAISFAIDRAAIVKSVLYGHGTVANSQVTPALWDYNPKNPGLQYNLAQAKKEIALSKYAKGFKVKLLVGSGNQNELTMGQIVQSELAPLGITVTLQEVNGAQENTLQSTSQFQMSFLYDTTDIIDPDELMTFAAVGGSGAQGTHAEFTNYNNPQVDSLVTKAEGVFSQAARIKIYDQIQLILAQDPPMAYLFYQPFAYSFTTKLHGFSVFPTGNYHLENVWLSK
jgi:peptide/nickel transport system substrate-binding protein